MKKILIIQNTFINGDTVSKGDVIMADENILRVLVENKKAVAYENATAEQLQSVKAEDNSEPEKPSKKGVK